MTKRDITSCYEKQIVNQTQRFLSWLDREPFSRTHGCFDRTFWCWKFTDFPGARFQEGIYALSYMFCNQLPDNCFTGNEKVLKWARAGMNFWRTLQYGDGSFDEAYPHEHSLAATAFTGFYIGEAFFLIKDFIPHNEEALLEETFQRAGDWLCANDEHHGFLSNHLAAAAAALNTIYRITGDEKYNRRSEYFLNKIYKRQSTEGWYEEYGGADPGYQTHCSFYLAWIWQNTKDKELLESLKRSMRFIKFFFHPNGTLGGEYGSRNTEFYFPAGFEILSSELPDAALIAGFMRDSIENQTAAGLSAMDTYNFLPMFNNYLFAAGHARDIDTAGSEMPCEKKHDTYFPDAGLYVKSNNSYYCVLGLSKGGVLKIYDRQKRQLIASDCGYWAELDTGKVASSQALQRSGLWEHKENTFNVKSDFKIVQRHIQTPPLFLGFRLFTLTLGRFRAAAYWLKNLLVHMLIHKSNKIPLELSRRVRFEENTILVDDHITMKGNIKVQTLKHGTKFATIHMGSSRYFQEQEIFVPQDDSNWADALSRDMNVDIARKIEFQSQ